MKFLLLILLAVGGYFLWMHFSKVEEPLPAAGVPAATPAPVDFAIKMRVKRILDEWKKQSLDAEVNKQRSSMLDIGVEVNEIRRRLYNQGLHDARSLKDTMVRAAVELGYSREQAQLLIGQVLGGR